MRGVRHLARKELGCWYRVMMLQQSIGTSAQESQSFGISQPFAVRMVVLGDRSQTPQKVGTHSTQATSSIERLLSM